LSFQAALAFAALGVIVYSAFAGLRGDILTDVVHFWAMIGVLFAFLLPRIALQTPASLLSRLPPELWSPVTFGGYQFLIAGLVFGAVLAVVSMEMWLRVYAASGPRQAKHTFVWSAFLVVPFYLAAMYFGFAGRALLPSLQNPDTVIFQLIFTYLPRGMLGLGLAAILAVLVSTANTMILVVSASVDRDLLRPSSTPRKGLQRSRLTTLVIGVVGLAFALVSPHVVQLILNAFYMIAILFPALIAGMFWHRATKLAATLSIALGATFTLVFLPIIPTQAFIPGAAAAILAFVIGVFLTKHSSSEDVDLLKEPRNERTDVS